MGNSVLFPLHLLCSVGFGGGEDAAEPRSWRQNSFVTLNWENLKVSQGSRQDTGRTISTFSKVGFQVETGLEVGG